MARKSPARPKPGPRGKSQSPRPRTGSVKKPKKNGADATAASLLRHSPYLAMLAARWPALCDIPPDAAEAALHGTLEKEAAEAQDEAALMQALRRAKQKIALIAGLADLGRVWDEMRVMQCLSAFADSTVRHAAGFLLRAAHEAGHIRLAAPSSPLKNCGMSVIALGKWGAGELNYSSDIDLMVLFDAARTPMKDKDAAQNFFIRLTRDLARLLEQPTADGYVFRCDLRLRPDPGAMPLAVSLPTAEVYYGSLGQNWERAAMIKARAVTGDARIAEDFARLMTAWIWRRNLDFAAIQDIHSIKRQINAKQAAPRGKHKTQENPYLGVNVKLGHGGIREIEFYVQTQQLIFGGRDVTLRAPSTCAALRALGDTGHITHKDAAEMTEAYLFLRRIEHRLQMIDDRQTHSLPAHEADFAAFADFAGYADAAALRRDLARHMGGVQKKYAALFRESQSLSRGDSGGGNLVFTGVDDDPDTLCTLRGMGFYAPEKVTAAIRGWHHGRYRAVRSERARQILTELTPQLLATLAATPHADEAFIRFDRFLEKLPSGVPIFSMFAHHPALLPVVADIMGTAPALAEWLGTHPQVLDGVISRDFFGALPAADWLARELQSRLAAARDYQDVLDITRRWAREKRFHAGIHVLGRLSAPAAAAAYLADIAETALAQLTPHVIAAFEKAHGKINDGSFLVLAMGSFAARAMFTDSDLDIVALYDAPENATASDGDKPLPPSQYYIRLTQRLITAITAPTSESVLYSVDARLRPAGGDGPLAVSVQGFLDYHGRQAWTWEHMSLIRHRVVFGKGRALRKLQGGIRAVLTAPRDAETLRRDITDMQARVRRERPGANPWDLKYRQGGLMDILFAVQYAQLRHAAQNADVLQPDMPAALAALAATRAMPAADARLLAKAHGQIIATQMFLRLAAALPFDPAAATPGLRSKLAEILSDKPPAKNKRAVKPDFKPAAAGFMRLLTACDKTCRALLAAPKTRKKTAKRKPRR